MARSLFDPDKAAGSPPPKGTAQRTSNADQPLTVSDAANLIASVLRTHTPTTVHVIGELTGFAKRTHWYFRLKDDSAILDCVMFASAARRVKFTPEDGMNLIISGRIEHYAKQGRTQLYVQSMQPAGMGELELRFRALCEELRALGWFDEARKKPLPTFPRRIAIVTSKTGAALQDVLDTMRKRFQAVEAVIVDVRVQGDDAAPQIARAIAALSSRHDELGIDAIILTRGGGSMEDLWAFNERVVARAILDCPVPIVAAIGHETDITIAELVADLRGATPTQAAMRLTPDRPALTQQLDQLAGTLAAVLERRSARELDALHAHTRGLVHIMQRGIATRQVALARLAERLARRRPEALLAARTAKADQLQNRLHLAMSNWLSASDLGHRARRLVEATTAFHTSCHQRLGTLERELVIASPQRVLARGYSLTTDASGHAIRSVQQVHSKQPITTRLADGSISSIISDSQCSKGIKGSNRQPPPRQRAIRQKRSNRDQMDLF